MTPLISSLINLYQKTLSPDHGPRRVLYPYGYCRHYPSCSEYTKIAVVEFGSIRGMGLGIKRVIKCHPFATPAVDMSCYRTGQEKKRV